MKVLNNNLFFPFAVIVILLSLGLCSPCAKAQQTAAFVVVSADSEVSVEFANDLTEALTFKLKTELDVDFLPKEKLHELMKYQGPKNQGSCLYDHDCLRAVRSKLGDHKWFVLGKISTDGDLRKLVFTRIADSSENDVTKTVSMANEFAAVLNKSINLVKAVIQKMGAFVLINVNPTDAEIFLNGAPLKNSIEVKVKPGAYKLEVRREGYQPFARNITCEENSKYMIPVELVKVNSEPSIGDPIDPDHLDPVEPETNLSEYTARRKTRAALISTGWITAIGSSAFVILAINNAFEVSNTEQELSDACAGKSCTISKSKYDSLIESGRSATKNYNWMLPTGISLFVAGATTALVGHLLPEKTLHATPIITPDTVGANMIFRF